MARSARTNWLTYALATLGFIALFSAIVVLNLVHSKVVYGNYRCAFAHCVIVQQQTPIKR